MQDLTTDAAAADFGVAEVRRAHLVLAGFGLDDLCVPRAAATFFNSLQGLFLIRLHAASSVRGPRTDLRPAERFYRWLDRLILGRNQWAPRACDLPPEPSANEVAIREELWVARDVIIAAGLCRACVVFEFEGRPLTELAEAIRQRLGHKGSALGFRILAVQESGTAVLLFDGFIRLDHRSLQRSIVRVAHKAADLIQAARVRIRQAPKIQSLPALSPPGTGLSPWALVFRIPAIVIRWMIFDEQWVLLLARHQGSHRVPQREFRRIEPPAGVFWADPFLARIDGLRLVFFEELPFETRRGHIAVLQLDEKGFPVARAEAVLKEDCHLSYPFVWLENGQTYLIPESAERRQVVLYRLSDSGRQCVRDTVLIDGERLADASIVRWEGRLWMFACRAEPDAPMDDVLHIYWAWDLRGPWTPHDLNPVKIDTRSARPAGAPWIHEGRLFRPAQDCADTYGSAVRCMRVSVLTPDRFEETEVEHWSMPMAGRSEPWHTFNADATFQVSDSLRRIPRWQTR